MLMLFLFLDIHHSPKFNIAPEQWWLENYFAFGKVSSGAMLNFGSEVGFSPVCPAWVLCFDLGVMVQERGISGGQRKRVNIGLELAARPTVLYLDEPLDQELQTQASSDFIRVELY